MADWEEIKRLAADFQRVQLSSTSQKLSERNCVEIVSWLIEKKLIDLIFTTDGKEYLTTSQLTQDIQNELYDNGGRLNLADLSKIIGVDLGHINNCLNEVLRSNKDIQHILGQLIDSTYLTKIAGEINEKLQQQGQINVGELTVHYDLPADFLQQQVLEKYVNKVIFAKQDKSDPKVFFTESFIARSKAKIRGALAGLTKPTAIASILSQIELSEKLFFTLFDQTSMYGNVTGRSSGAQYIPQVYARSQNEWVNNFFKQNGYLEYDALTRLGISDYKTYVKKQFGNEELVFVGSVVISKDLLDRVSADIDECIASKTYVDLQNTLPSVFNENDVTLILEKVLTGVKGQQVVALDNYILSKAYIEILRSGCDNLVKEKAKKVVESGEYQKHLIEVQGSQNRGQKGDDLEEKVDKREERRKKAAGGKSGGGTQGRETKTKSTKKHTRNAHKGHVDDDDEDDKHAGDRKVLQIVSKDDVVEIIQAPLEEEGLDGLVDPLADYLLPKFNEQGLELAADIFQTTVADKTANRRQTHNELQSKLNDLISDVRLFEKGVKLMPSDVQPTLVKYLLKTLCTDIVNEILNYLAAESNSSVVTDSFNNDQRLKFVSELPQEFKADLTTLVKSLSGQSIDDFMTAIDSGLQACSMIQKKIDKKKDRTTVLNHKHQLLEQLDTCEDLALVLHLAVLVIFTTATNYILHASGRHVSTILTFLKPYVSERQSAELMSYHDFVTLMLSNGSEAENAKEKLKEKVHIIKQIAHEFKKSGAGEKS